MTRIFSFRAHTHRIARPQRDWRSTFASGVAMFLVLSSASMSPATNAQQVWRCGNEYTNNAVQARQQGCRPIEGHVTIVHSDKPSPTRSTDAASTSSSQIAPAEQQTRNQGARAILQAELKKAQERLNTLLNEYNDGNPAKDALGLRNPQTHLDRIHDLKTKIERQRSDIESLERELGQKK